MTYKHTEYGIVIIAVYLVLIGISLYVFTFATLVNILVVSLALLVFAAILFPFMMMEITVNDNQIEIAFGKGRYKYRWLLDEVESISVSTKVIYSIGINIQPEEFKFGLKPGKALVLDVNGKKVFIVTSNAEVIKQQLEVAMLNKTLVA